MDPVFAYQKRKFWIIFIITIIFLEIIDVLVGFAFFSKQHQLFIESYEKNLDNVALLKKQEVEKWLAERLNDGLVFSSLWKEENFFLNTSSNIFAYPPLQKSFNQLAQISSYHNIFLLDERRNFLAQWKDEPVVKDSIKSKIKSCTENTSAYLSEFFLQPALDAPSLLTIVPFCNGNYPARFLIFESDLGHNFFPMLQKWPTSSKTGEVLLVKQKNKDVEYINDLKFQSKSAFKLTIPLNSPKLLAAKVLRGEEGPMEGNDYRGKSVLGAAYKIKDTPYAVVTKIEMAELESDFFTTKTLICAIVILIFIFVLVAASLVIYIIRLFFTQKTLQEISLRSEISAKYERELLNAKEKAESANLLKSLFLSTISHEIRTPMNGIIGIIDMLKTTPLSPLQQEFLCTADNSVELLIELVNNVLDYSKIEAGSMQLEPCDINLREMVETVQSLFIMAAKEKGLKLLSEIKEGTPETIIADKVRIQQVLSNLISNAIKFSKSGCVKIEVDLDSLNFPAHDHLLQEGPYIKFIISDEGIGLTGEQIKNLFTAFYQARPMVGEKCNGTGLGLAISKRLVELHGGIMGVESSLGYGAKFWFTIPCHNHAKLHLSSCNLQFAL